MGADAKNFKIHFKGGGWCFDDKSCLGRSKQWLGSSKQWGPVPAGTAGDPTKNPSEGVQGLLNNNASNPFGRWTAIFVEYCDGTSYTSDRAEPVSVGGERIYYRGWRILNALIDDWLKQGMDEAGAVILSGTSAGWPGCSSITPAAGLPFGGARVWCGGRRPGSIGRR